METVIAYTENETLLRVHDLEVTYGLKKIIHRISFSITDTKREGCKTGQVLAIVGRSGRGKSTLLNAITAMVKPSSGTVEIFDGNGGLRPLKEGEVGFVQQNYPLSRNQSVNDMLMQAAAQAGIPSNKRQNLVDEKLKEWNLEKQKFQSANQLSGGQRQRVSILEQIICCKHCIVLDEPFSGLDVKNKMDVRESFERISAADDTNTIIFTTHEIGLAVELADTIIVIGYPKDDQGELVQVGQLLQTYNLKEMGLAWHPYSPEHEQLRLQIEQIIKAS
jgi:ABC-type multidrug transport system ATPase subunit